MRLLFALLLAVALQAAPPVKLQTLDEATYPKTVAALKGKVVLVNFWATWCEPCRKEMPALAKLAAGLKAKGVELVTVSADEPEDEARAIAFLKNATVSAPAYLKKAKDDEKFINALDAKWSGALPALFLYDRKGVKVKSFIGETPLKTLEAELQKLL